MGRVEIANALLDEFDNDCHGMTQIGYDHTQVSVSDTRSFQPDPRIEGEAFHCSYTLMVVSTVR